MKVEVTQFLALLICCCSIAGCTQNSKPEQYEGIEILEFDGEIRFSALAWSPDGQMLAAKYQIDPLGGASAAIIDITSGTFQTILPEQVDYYIAPEWSPDSKSLIVTTYVARPTEDTPFNIFVIDAQNGQTIQGVWYGSIATWSNEPDKVILIDSAVGHLDEQVSILEIDLESGEYRQFAQTEAAEAQISDSFDVSVDGYLAVMNQEGLEIYDVISGQLVGNVNKWVRTVNWSPDGEMFVFTYDPKETGKSIYHDHIYLSTPDGACLSDPLDLRSRIWTIDWSPDGEQLVFATFEPGKIYFIDLTKGPGKELIDSFTANCPPA